jgi:hypothetical protein
VEPEDVVHVLRRHREALVPNGIVLDLQVIRPHPLVEVDGTVVCEIDGSPLFVGADAARAAVDLLVAERLLEEEAVDDHDVRKHYVDGASLVADFETSSREIPVDAIPRLQAVKRECVVRERCRLRRLRRIDAASTLAAGELGQTAR